MRSKLRIRLAPLLAVVAIVMISGEASAQRKPRKIIKISNEIRIEGRIQKPQAFYILQRSTLNFEGLELKNSFVPKIIKSVDQAPF